MCSVHFTFIISMVTSTEYSSMQLIDTHSHIDIKQFKHDFSEVLRRSRNAGVVAQILPGVVQKWWHNLLSLTNKHIDLYPALGLHPMYLPVHLPEHLEKLERLARKEALVAIGEIGLDYFVKDIDHAAQQHLFETQLDIAAACNLPVLLHVRKAHDQVQATLRRKKFSCGGIVHAFGGSLQQAHHYLNLGFKISFGGTITYSRATKIRGVAAKLPIDSIVLETDAPDIPPADHHGERNSPEYLPEVLCALAKLRTESDNVLAMQTTKNAMAVLSIDELPDPLVVSREQ